VGELRMPALGADMEAGTLVEWQIKPGDEVKRGQVVALVETEKGVIEIEIWESGVIDKLVVAPGTKVPVGTVLATLVGATEAPAPPAPVPRAAHAPPAAPAPTAPPVSPPSHVLASPAAKRLALERGVDLATLHGTGPHGVVTRADVERAAAPAKPAVGVDLAKMRRAVAAAMARSKREIPHYYLSTEVDASPAIDWLARANERLPVPERMLLAAVWIKATARAAREVPEINGFFENDAFRASSAVHAGVAISLRGGGLVAPAIHDAGDKTIAEINAALTDLVARARAGRLRSSEMTDPTITITNLGERGVETVFGVIYPPQVALVGFGKVVERPWASGGMLGVRPVVTVTLSADHRASEGHRGALFLAAVARLLERPEDL
jgi:pyruvate dehydrogenase E2 component (dihydrolipoamide acetyltransferase)